MEKRFENFKAGHKGDKIDYLDTRDAFLKLTRHTVPYGKEHDYLKDLLPNYLKKDSFGNLYFKVGGDKVTTCFTSHLDTVGGDVEVKHVFEGDMVKAQNSILGADDKAGVVIMLYMITKKVPGLYYFFLGEESGKQGSGKVAGQLKSDKEENKLFKNIDKVISFDRKDYNSIITHQMGSRTCSDEFADDLASKLNEAGDFKFIKDTGGSFTDSESFYRLIPECTNLSVGYFNQHMHSEKQDLDFLQRLSEACTKVDWDSVVVKRDPSKEERLSYGRGTSWYGGDWYEYGEMGYGYEDYDVRPRTSHVTRSYPQTARNVGAAQGGMVTDYKGNRVSVEDAVWCEYDKQWCLKDEAIWEDYVGFYTTPDTDMTENTPRNASGAIELPASTRTGQMTKTRPLTEDSLVKGLEIEHESFGLGTLKDWNDNKTVLTIDFKTGGTRKIHFPIAKTKIKF